MATPNAGPFLTWEEFSTASYKAYSSFYENNINKTAEVTIQEPPEPYIPSHHVNPSLYAILVLVFVLSVKVVKDITQ